MKGLKKIIQSSSKLYEQETANLVKQMWEHVCTVGALDELILPKGNLIVKVFADCLWTIKYTPVPFDVCEYAYYL